jgi:phage-related minor tail protein
MGEAGPEGILPLRRTRQGRLGVEASGVAPAINIYVEADSEWVRATARDESGRVVARSSPRIVAAAVKRAGDEVVPRVEKHRREQQGDWR